jgi:TonB family protein
MTAAPSIALLAVAASVLCYQDCDRAIRSGALIDEYSRAACVPVKLAAGISPPSRGWDYTLKTHAGVPVRVFGSDIVGGEIEVEYLPDGKKAVAANAGDYIYPADVRFERTNDRLYVKANGQPAFFGGPQTWLFEYDLAGRRQTARAKVDPSVLPQECPLNPAVTVKLIKSPIAPFPDEALRKNVQGNVILSISVDAQGKVSDVKVVSGPPELFQAAINSVKQWEFEPPSHAPVLTTAEVSYFHPEQCPGPISEMGEVYGPAGRLTSKKATVVTLEEDNDQELPPYFPEDRKSGAAGEMVLSVTVEANGKPSKVYVLTSLSPHLDQAAIETVRSWKFKLIKGSPDALPDDFEVKFQYRATCTPSFVMDSSK